MLWVHLQALSNNTFALPVSDRNGQRRLWLTRFIGLGSTGKVWQGHFDNSDDSFSIKIVELLYPSDMDSRQRLRNENMVQYMVACSPMVAGIEIGRPSAHSSFRCSSERDLF
jgi:hypothetical protein